MKRPLYIGLGLFFLLLGIIGAALPLLPTVPFLLLAAFFFARSHPEWAQRLYDHPRYGESLRRWRDRGAISRQAKVASSSAMTVGILIAWLTVGYPWFLISVAALVLVAPWIWTRPE